MRSIRHPGPVNAERSTSAPCTVDRVHLTLQPGKSVNEAVANAFHAARASSGFVRLRGATVAPMRYVIPAAAPDDTHAAWYSETHAPDGVCTIEDAGMIIGLRDGEPFLHCHGSWLLPNGERRMGHLLPLESQFSQSVEAEAWLVSGARFDVRDDAETNFRLFHAVEDTDARLLRGTRAVLCTIRPNQDIGAAIEGICRDHGIANASIEGIGSLVGAEFEDGSRLASYATEVLVRHGDVRDGRCTLDIALVGMAGEIGEGRLVAGVNAVCVTFELLVVEA
jgi:predicted DNA-binding protein with PD1-like motif